MIKLSNYLSNQWQPVTSGGGSLSDPVTGQQLAVTSGPAAGLALGFNHARTTGAAGLQSMTYAQRAAMLGQIVTVLKAQREDYYAISLTNSGTTKADSAIDIEGALFTLGYYAKLGADIGATHTLADGEAASLAKDNSFQSQHILKPVKGLALFINAFNFPSWGLWEKAAPALLSGVPVVIKPATATAWLTHRMVTDVIEAGILPSGALSIVCGSSQGLLDALRPFDVLSFTGSADTAALIRRHDAVARHSVRVNIEADSLNCSILGPDAAPGTASFDLYVNELVREMTTKSGQRCTAIRRALIPAQFYNAVAEATSARLAQITVGNPRNETVRMGSLVSRAQFDSVQSGLSRLRSETTVLYDGSRQNLIDVDRSISACMAPTLLGQPDADQAPLANDHEIFGPVSTLLGYRDSAHALELAERGMGSLVSSVFSADHEFLARIGTELASTHGRVHLVSPDAEKSQTGHGNVMPASIHGGPGRAGGGEELGGMRGLNFYHRRAALQASSAVLQQLK